MKFVTSILSVLGFFLIFVAQLAFCSILAHIAVFYLLGFDPNFLGIFFTMCTLTAVKLFIFSNDSPKK